MEKKTAITTVGISLLGSLKQHKIDINLLVDEILNYINALEDHTKIAAEISLILSIINEGILAENQNLYLLSSDIPEGKKINEILKEYFKPLFHRVHTFTIENLNGEKSDLFKDEGLRNLVKMIVQIVRVVPGKEKECVINATGGYKAQISFAGLIGQVLKIPVYYQFEGFSSVIQLPEIPVSLDYKIWLKNFHLFKELYNLGVVSTKLLLEHVDLQPLQGLIEQSREQIRLSSVGLLMHEVLWRRFQEEGILYLPTSAQVTMDKNIEGFSQDLPLSLQTILLSINQLPYVKKVRIISSKDQLSGPLGFHIKDLKEGIIRGSYGQDNKTWIFDVETTATNEVEINAAIVELYQRFQPMTEGKQESSIEFILVRHGQHVGEKDDRYDNKILLIYLRRERLLIPPINVYNR
ncbi:putative CRISPR-associated protein [Bacillus alveayuensis]|jgi:putative CRISPR-associated protein (TIGR02619 family)|uniref:putative CRISPR-associated protein n=1 Tax=Aeribacillus alveayuensis TaxID=279215 RepID=UPI0006990269|nr:putative CRISPR-associated protein [Bacillus alveayuensis]